ncbi:phosphatidylserine decarboxylase [Stratiformator vulcanicus]|uniref:Phosphatidylserine decarboxylase n=1 Tax=Stratiformator vulcanicus TaxID=2527980 RepID=A0A517QYH6_9PLAN|nr:phosphatidylserine decarboxylase [Stratiformator vulcanicus]QDT36600.1 phosphatidylserine decarboxylase [Stratiformator vulcanicus]
MSETPQRLPIEQPDPSIWCIQPAGGWAMRIERWWRRRETLYERVVDPAMVEDRQRELLHRFVDLPSELAFWSDLKYTVNQFDKTETFRFVDYIARVRRYQRSAPWGTAEIAILIQLPAVLFFVGSLFAAYFIARVLEDFGYAITEGQMLLFFAPYGVLILLIVAAVHRFFRDPPRKIVNADNLVLAPADGKVVEVTRLDHHPFIGGPAIRVGVFLSLFDVHLQRFPVNGRVIGVSWHPGKQLNALRPEAARENEAIETRIEEHAAPHRRIVVRQIAGMIASKVVNILRPGDELEAGERIGMIKFGSRCEIIVPDVPELELHVAAGMRLKAGESLIARWVDLD